MPKNKRCLGHAGWVFAVLAVFLDGCASPQARPGLASTSAGARLAELMARRLEISRHVAWVKFQNHLPVSDTRRKAELLASLVRRGEEIGLPPEDVETFFAAQIRASCVEQRDLIFRWKRGAALPAWAAGNRLGKSVDLGRRGGCNGGNRRIDNRGRKSID